MGTERRRSPRVEIVDAIRSSADGLEGAVVVREMSLGGMAVETPFVMDIDSVRTFRLTLGDGATVEVAGRIRHSRNLAPAGKTHRYLVGVEFVDEDADGPAPVRHYLDRQS